MGGLQHWAEMAWLLLGLTIEPLVGTGWAIFLLLCMNGLRKWSSGHVGPAVKLFSQSVGVTIGQDP